MSMIEKITRKPQTEICWLTDDVQVHCTRLRNESTADAMPYQWDIVLCLHIYKDDYIQDKCTVLEKSSPPQMREY